MPIPDYGLYNENGKQILNADPRFNHYWYASKVIYPYDNDDMVGIKFSNAAQGEDWLQSVDTDIVPVL